MNAYRFSPLARRNGTAVRNEHKCETIWQNEPNFLLLQQRLELSDPANRTFPKDYALFRDHDKLSEPFSSEA
jgi:hypothetical protein